MFSEKNVLNSQKVLQPLKISEPAREQYSKHGEIEVFKRLALRALTAVRKQSNLALPTFSLFNSGILPRLSVQLEGSGSCWSEFPRDCL